MIELGFWVAGPATGGLLADWGADVVKIEPPTGDPMRGIFMTAVGLDLPINPPFELDNRGKRSMAVDLKTEEGREVVRRLCDGSDVFVSNLRPGALERMGLEGSVLYPTIGLAYGLMREVGFATATATAYNNWLEHEYTRKDDRLFGVGLMPVENPEGAVAEMRRCKQERKNFVQHRYRFKFRGNFPSFLKFMNRVENDTRYLRIDDFEMRPFGPEEDDKGVGELVLAEDPRKEIMVVISTYTYSKLTTEETK